MPVVASVNEALLNAQAFSGVDNAKSSIAYQNFSLFYHWYYFPNIDVFAPSKFIGYQNTTLHNYSGHGKTGTDTQRALSRWFTKVPTSDNQYQKLRLKLDAFATSIGKTISTKTFNGTGGIYLLSEKFAGTEFPDEVPEAGFKEGVSKRVSVNVYERNLRARAECIAHYGAKCGVCNFNFEEVYGKELGAGFIHVHHLIEISTIGKAYVVDPIKDLLPVCPNCHSMLHRLKPALLPQDLRKFLVKFWS